MKSVALLLVAATAFVTLGPPRYRPVTDLGQDGEHALAFALVGLALGAAFSRRWLTAALAVGFTGAIELLQVLAPGRHARLEDFIVDAAALCGGLAAAAFLRWALRRRQQTAAAD